MFKESTSENFQKIHLLSSRYILDHTSMGQRFGPDKDNEDSESRSSRGASNESSGGRTEDLAKKYYATLTRAQMEGIKGYYRPDFLAFNYDPDIFDHLISK